MQEKEPSVSAFEAMLLGSAKDHLQNACKNYSFDFFNERSICSDETEPFSPLSPFEWREEENNVEYFKPTVKLELKPRMSVSDLMSKTEVQECSKGRQS
jgi:hypothetical protein